MKNPNKLTFLLFVVFPLALFSQENLETYPPEGFVYVHKAVPTVEYDIRYASNNNFIGGPIEGYENPVALITTEAAEALKQVQQTLKGRGYHLKVFDAYRPQRAVNHFIEWAKDTSDTLMKPAFYPDVDKTNLFELGYIASRSGHTRGSTIDLTLVNSETGEEVDMGSPYDFFGEISHHGAEGITAQQQANRMILKDAMTANGFKALPHEWWHYTLENEPYPDTYFDFPVK